MPSPELLDRLRASRPAASPALRARVSALAAHEPERTPRRLRLPVPRVALVLAPACAAALALGVLGYGFARSGPAGPHAAPPALESVRSAPLAGAAKAAAPMPRPAPATPTQGVLDRMGDAALWLAAAGLPLLAAAALLVRYRRRRADARLLD